MGLVPRRLAHPVVGRALLLVIAAVSLLSGCSCSIQDAHTADITDDTVCVAAHDEVSPGTEDILTICDRYTPRPVTSP